MFERAAEGYDTFGIAGTGYGKTMAFRLLAVAAEIAKFRGVVIVICLLKALQKDQVGNFI